MNVAPSLDIPVPPARFGWITGGAEQGPHPVFDRALAVTPNFVALPSLGSLVPGWLLLVPRRPILNMRGLSSEERNELSALRRRLSTALANAFGNTVHEFEHGATSLGSLSGCGVDQAHLHMAPLPFDLVDATRDLSPLRAFGDMSNPWQDVGDAEYVLIRSAEEKVSYGFYPERPSSQLVRRLIASRLGMGEAWNYREHTFEANARTTIERLRL